jgi:probable HAF family extracellular repeat protein
MKAGTSGVFPSRVMVLFLLLFASGRSFCATFDAERLEGLPDNRSVLGLRINNSGEVLGSSLIALAMNDTAVLWRGTNISAWLPLGDILNDSGMVAGQKLVGFIAIEVPVYAAIVVSNGVPVTIKPLGAGSMGPLGINNSGQVVGVGDLLTNRAAFLWQNGKTVDLNTLVDDGPNLDVGRSIADDGTIYASTYVLGGGAVVYRLTPTNNGRYNFERLFETDRDPYMNQFGQGVAGRSLWDKSGIHDLGDLGVPERVYAFSVNSSEQVVGMAAVESEESYHAVFYDGKLHDLNRLVSINNTVFNVAYSINEYGQIATIAWNGRTQEVYRLTPRPEFDVVGRAGNDLSLTVRPGARRKMHIEVSDDLLTWRELLQNDLPDPVMTLKAPTSTRVQMFRLWRE